MPSHHEMDRLEQAMAAWLRFRSGGEGTEQEFLARHEHLRDLLVPMMHGTEPEDSGSTERVLGDFHLRREIGRGGMGVVYEAWQASLDRRVAVKVLLPHLMKTARSVARFKQEASTAARMDHPGIVDVITVGSDDDTHYFAMEFIEGAPLDQLMAAAGAGGLDIQTAVELVAKVADALQYAHDHGVIHRDVKPQNILVRDDGRPVLTDFGLAREEDLPAMTRTGEFAGTPYYVSPEQALSVREGIDHRTDIFSLGATLFELLTQRRPFDGETNQAVVQQILMRDPPNPQKLNPALAPDLVAVLLKALEKDRRLRYGTAREFADDLRSFLAYRPVSAHRLTRMHRLRRWVRREPLKAALAATLIAGVPALSVAGGYIWASQEEISKGQQTIREEELEGLLGKGFERLAIHDHTSAGRLLRQAKTLAPDSIEPLAGLALSLTAQQQHSAALALLSQHEARVLSSPALLRIRWRAMQYSVTKEHWLALRNDLPERTSAFDFFVSGIDQLEDSDRSPNQLSFARAAMQSLTRAVIRSRKPRPIYHCLRILAAAKCGSQAVALDSAHTIEELWPNLPLTFRWLGIAYERSNPDRARACFDKAVADDPKDGWLHFAVGRFLYQCRKYDEAESAFERAIESGLPAGAAPYLRIAQIKIAKGDITAAMRLCSKQFDLGQPPANECRGVVTLLTQARHFQEAAKIARKSLQHYPNQPRLNRDLGLALRRLGQLNDALPYLRRACKLEPEHGPNHYSLGVALAAAKDYRGSAQAWERCVKLMAPGSNHPRRQIADAHYNLALQYYRLREFQKCVPAARKAAAIDNQPRCWHLLGVSLAMLGFSEEARTWLRKALRAKPDHYTKMHRNVASYFGRQPALRPGAVVLRKTLVEQHPKARWAHNELVRALQDMDDTQAVALELQRWTSIQTDSAEAWTALARHVLKEQGSHRQRLTVALDAARSAVRISERQDPLALATLSDACHALGDHAAAARTAQQALDKLGTGETRDAMLRERLRKRVDEYRKQHRNK